MANLSQEKRQRMLSFLNQLKAKNRDDDETLMVINEIENALNEKKYGLVWEQHEEAVDVKMRTHIPVFTEDRDKEITAAPGEPYNFLLEGDNLHSLKLLEKTHRGKIDLIYIDPPYNTENKDFIYDDKKIDDTDGFQHSKWISFMYERLCCAKQLIKESGVIAISIGVQEVNNLMLLCKEIFSNKNIICVTVQTSSGNAVANGFTVMQEYMVFIVPDNFKPQEIESEKKDYSNPYHGMNLSGFNQQQRPNQVYPIFIDDRGNVVGCGKSLQRRIDEGIYHGEKADFTYDYGEAPEGTSAVWPITRNNDSCVWRLIPEQFMENWKKGYIKIVPNKKGPNKFTVQYLSGGIINQIESGKLQTRKIHDESPTLEVIGFKTKAGSIQTIWTDNKYLTAAGSKNLKDIFNHKVQFNFPKPLELIKDVLRRVTVENTYILDFFAGSGTTAQAVLELNQEDGGHRQFILCTNNENHICEDVTYPRVKTVITGMRQDDSQYSDGIPANLKYYRTDFVSKDEEFLSDALLSHIAEMIQLEHGVKLDGKQYIMVLSDEDADRLAKNWQDYPDVKALYISSDVLLTAEQENLFQHVAMYIIPDHYFDFELREVGESW